MSDGKKTIKINPEIFNIGTRKNREKKTPKSTNTPLITPNILKNKLLKRIKEHKISENKNSNGPGNHNQNDVKSETSTFSDEFSDSIEYLQSLSKQKKKEDEIERKKHQLLNKTVRSFQPSSFVPHVELELPEDLRPVVLPKFTSESSLKINYEVDKDVPYGCLKGGYKPTFRDLSKTRKVYEVSKPSATMNVVNVNLEREQRLNILKNKLKAKKEDVDTLSFSGGDTKSNVGFNQENPIFINTEVVKKESIPFNRSEIDTTVTHIPTRVSAIPLNKVVNNVNVPVELPEKQFIKKTIKKTYNLGKSKNNRSVAILIKDNKTRKNIINAQKELKHHAISDVKKYLREHNLIKSGSNAPNDVVRKLYESCMLAGEITNLNKDTLLHNFIKEPN
jgi:hypothetical protein